MKLLGAGICIASISACATPPPSPTHSATYGPRPSANQAKAAAITYVCARGLEGAELRDIRVGNA